MADIESILALEVPVSVRLGERRMKLGDVVGLSVGTIVELPKHVDEELELLVGAKPIALGEAVKVGENFGIRLSFVGDLRSRIEAMGAGPASQEPEDDGPSDDEIAESLLAGQL